MAESEHDMAVDDRHGSALRLGHFGGGNPIAHAPSTSGSVRRAVRRVYSPEVAMVRQSASALEERCLVVRAPSACCGDPSTLGKSRASQVAATGVHLAKYGGIWSFRCAIESANGGQAFCVTSRRSESIVKRLLT